MNKACEGGSEEIGGPIAGLVSLRDWLDRRGGRRIKLFKFGVAVK